MQFQAFFLAQLKQLFPGYFALVMASGVLALACYSMGYTALALLLGSITVVIWCILLFLSSLRLWLFPAAVKKDLLDIRRVFAFFTFIAATSFVGVISQLAGYSIVAILCWGLAFVSWSLLLYLSFSVLTFLSHPHSVNVVHGGWLIAIVATYALVLLGVEIAPSLGPYTNYMLVEVNLLWALGLVLYGIFVTLFSYRIFFERFEPADISPLLWVVMGAAASGVSAGTSLLKAPQTLHFLSDLRPFIDGMVMVLWAWATWWIPMLLLFGIWKHIIRKQPLYYEPILWSMVFPLGMYAVASYRLGLAAEFPPLQWISIAMLWVALSVWVLVFVAMLRAWLKLKDTYLAV